MNLFNKNKKIIIGSLHLPPLIGIDGHMDFEKGKKFVLKDFLAFQDGGVDAVIYENNYDIPHTEFLNIPQVVEMTRYGEVLKKISKIPLGVSTLWNDYTTSLSISSLLGMNFIRVPVFVDKVKTSYGIIEGDPKSVIDMKRLVDAKNISIFTDIHVKHAKLISKLSLVQSAKKAIKYGSNGLILTGKWTGDAPNMDQLKMLRKGVGNFPIILGSGVDIDNISDLLKYADGVIVSTSLKKNSSKGHRINIKPYENRVSKLKVKKLVKLASKTAY